MNATIENMETNHHNDGGTADESATGPTAADNGEKDPLTPPYTSTLLEANDTSVEMATTTYRVGTNSTINQEPILNTRQTTTHNADDSVSDICHGEDDDTRLIQLTRDFIEIVKSSSQGITLGEISRRLALPQNEKNQDDIVTVCECLEGIGLLHNVVGTEKDSASTSKVVSWWESAATDGTRVSFSSLRNKLSLLVREEAKLDVWLSRLRNLRHTTATTDVYVTPSDIHRNVTAPNAPSNEGIPINRDNQYRKHRVMAIHAPFGSMVEISQPRGTEGDNCDNGFDVNDDDTARRERKMGHVLVSSKRKFIPNQVDESDPTQQHRRLVREGMGDQSLPQVQVLFLPDQEGNERLRALHDEPVMKLIEEPAYISNEIQRRLTMSVGDDRYNVSCLQPNEGASSFF